MAVIPGRGAQAVLSGSAQLAARGAYGTTLDANTAQRDALIAAGTAPSGSTVDGTTSSGAIPTQTMDGPISFDAGTVNVTGQLNPAIQQGVTASTTQTLAAGTKITADVVIVTKCANDFDALTLPTLSTVTGSAHRVTVLNTAAKKATVFPGETGTKIDAGSASAAVTITGASQATFIQSGPADWITTNGGTITKGT